MYKQTISSNMNNPGSQEATPLACLGTRHPLASPGPSGGDTPDTPGMPCLVSGWPLMVQVEHAKLIASQAIFVFGAAYYKVHCPTLPQAPQLRRSHA